MHNGTDVVTILHNNFYQDKYTFTIPQQMYLDATPNNLIIIHGRYMQTPLYKK